MFCLTIEELWESSVVTNANTTENTVIAGALVVIVLMLIIAVFAKMYAKYIRNRINEAARSEAQLNTMRQV